MQRMHQDGEIERFGRFIWNKHIANKPLNMIFFFFFHFWRDANFPNHLEDTKISSFGESIKKSKKNLHEKNSDLSPPQILLSRSFLERGASLTMDIKLMNSSTSLLLRRLRKDKSHESKLEEFQLAKDIIKQFVLQETIYIYEEREMIKLDH